MGGSGTSAQTMVIRYDIRPPLNALDRPCTPPIFLPHAKDQGRLVGLKGVADRYVGLVDRYVGQPVLDEMEAHLQKWLRG
jgi:hypothetical protein